MDFLLKLVVISHKQTGNAAFVRQCRILVLRHSLKNAPARVNGPKKARLAQLRFSLAEEQDTPRIQCVVKSFKNLLLRLSVKVDENVPTDHQIAMRDRCIANHIAATENNH